MIRRRNRRPRKGAALVEFIFAVPLLFLFLFGALEFTRAFMLLHTADNAAYEGARNGIVPGANATDVENTAREVMRSIGARQVEVTVTPRTIDNSTDSVRVDVSIPVGPNGFVTPFFFKNKTVNSTITLEREEFEQVVVN